MARTRRSPTPQTLFDATRTSCVHDAPMSSANKGKTVERRYKIYPLNPPRTVPASCLPSARSARMRSISVRSFHRRDPLYPAAHPLCTRSRSSILHLPATFQLALIMQLVVLLAPCLQLCLLRPSSAASACSEGPATRTFFYVGGGYTSDGDGGHFWKDQMYVEKLVPVKTAKKARLTGRNPASG